MDRTQRHRSYLASRVLLFVCGLAFLLDQWVGGAVVQAQTDPNAPAAPNAVYLPLIASPTGKSGIHLGNRSSDWQPAFLQHLQPPPNGAADGHWPVAVVVQSNQIYDFRRDTTGRCWINGATVKQNNQKDYVVYDYLTRAISRTNGTIVVIRITPSPGNFLDYDHPGLRPHTLLIGDTPAGDNYCPPTQPGELSQADKVKLYRDIHDLVAEMNAIYQVNIQHGWKPERVYFEPANEPNAEWYQQKGNVDPNIDNKKAWIAMDDYFAALYDLAKQTNPNLQILAPSMAQGARGELTFPGTCDNTNMTVDDNNRTGFDFMKKTYGYDFEGDVYSTPKADGFAWHNYWKEGQEAWEPIAGVLQSLDDICAGNRNYSPKSDHLYQYFSKGMEESIALSAKPTFITEADLQSPCQDGRNNIKSKDQLPDGNDYAYRTRNSLLTFVSQEIGAWYVIAWLLVNEFPDEANKCGKDYPNHEINWHEAYTESGDVRLWFTLWWHDAQ